jgi:single-strand DNA-binding protein
MDQGSQPGGAVMARGYQQTTIVGNLGRDPEMRYTQQGTAVTSFSVAVTTGSGNYEHTEWFRCSAWERLAEVVNEYAHKGSRVMCVGTLKTRSYEDKEGVTRYSTDLTVREFVLLDSKRSVDEEEEFARTRNRPQPVDVSEDDFPF